MALIVELWPWAFAWIRCDSRIQRHGHDMMMETCKTTHKSHLLKCIDFAILWPIQKYKSSMGNNTHFWLQIGCLEQSMKDLGIENVVPQVGFEPTTLEFAPKYNLFKTLHLMHFKMRSFWGSNKCESTRVWRSHTAYWALCFTISYKE